MIAKDLVFVATSDLAGKVRGKAYAASDFEKRALKGVGWTPTNALITCFDDIAQSPFGALGDLLLVPDPSAEVNVDFEDGQAPERFIMGDILTLEGNPWECCTRAILKDAMDKFRELTGCEVIAAFEHEFHLKNANRPIGDGYSLAGFRANQQFGRVLIAALEKAGLAPDTFMKEYGVDQYEVTVGPKRALRAADEAAILRELTRSTALRLGDEASFTPLRNFSGIGNGVHIHMSFIDGNAKPATYDKNGPEGMSQLTGSFIAGILKYLNSIVALTAPSLISYARLTPHRWSAAFNNLGVRDREASVRICPTTAKDTSSIARQYNFEYRAADAAASPHLALAALIYAGIQGIEENLPAPKPTQEDLSLLDETTLASRGFAPLPADLETALKNFSSNEVVAGWFRGNFPEVYRLHKQGEIEVLKDKSEAEINAAYETVY